MNNEFDFEINAATPSHDRHPRGVISRNLRRSVTKRDDGRMGRLHYLYRSRKFIKLVK